jgi:hypothetical protein
MKTEMRTDTQIKLLGFEVLNKHLGLVDAEKFVTLIHREKFNYTEWRQNLFAGMSGREISQQAMDFHQQSRK